MIDAAAERGMDKFLRKAAHQAAIDWQWKLLALLLATFLYFFIRASIRHTETLVVPLDIDPQAQVAVATIEPLSVLVTVQGTLREIQRFNSLNLSMIVRPSVSGNSAGRAIWLRRWWRSVTGNRSVILDNTEEFHLSARNLQGTSDKMQIIKIEPKTVKVTYDDRGKVQLPVAEPVVIGKPYRGRVVVDYMPKTVWVEGSRKQLANMKANGVQLQTDPVDVDGRVQDYDKKLSILQPSMTRLLTFKPAEISAKIKIVTDRFTREFQNIELLVASASASEGGWTAQPPTVTVRVTGRAEVVSGIQTNQVTALVNVRHVNGAAARTVPVQIVLPFDVTVEAVEIDPATVTVAAVPSASVSAAMPQNTNLQP